MIAVTAEHLESLWVPKSLQMLVKTPSGCNPSDTGRALDSKLTAMFSPIIFDVIEHKEGDVVLSAAGAMTAPIVIEYPPLESEITSALVSGDLRLV